MGHPRPLWMLFMTEFWERFAFYGIRWAFVLYVVAQFYDGAATGEAPAGKLYGAYLALVYAGAIFGGYVADKILGYQRSILLGAVFMTAGLFMIAIPSEHVFKLGLATVIVGNGMFKPIISTLVGKLYATGDARRDSGFTIFYMGINSGAFIAPIITQYLAKNVFGVDNMPAYKIVFIASGIGMILSFLWFWFGRAKLKGIGLPNPGNESISRIAAVVAGALCAIPLFYFLLTIPASALQWYVLAPMFAALCVLLLVEGIRNGAVARDKVIAMLVIFLFNILFFMFFEQAGSSFTFLADKIVNRDLGFVQFENAWFQSVNSVAIIVMAPIIAWIWMRMGRANPSIPRKFALGIIFNGLAFLLLMYALASLVDIDTGKIPFWTLFAVYWIQSIGELCLSPVGLSMTTKLAPEKLVGFGMGGWFLSTGIGNNLSGLFAAEASGEGGMTVASAHSAYTSGFWILMIGGVALFLLSPLIQKLMHGVK
ncbi:oligopeptide:H+ symporter [Lysobacter sp. HDW10]|uniref:peptide MFS transporter n=1 Tax=Lysobacter sp. HDW10 TaxID=2714936 RepID=UPI001F0D4E11|nr:oligopeptide:H+ symporter [Lysobacter sp. HDW10]